MGEIGIAPDLFRYGLKWWEIRSIVRGYNRRNRDLWSSTRWQTYNLMSSFCGSEAMQKAGIHKPTDLIKFPWDALPTMPISQEEAKELQAEMEAINAGLADNGDFTRGGKGTG